MNSSWDLLLLPLQPPASKYKRFVKENGERLHLLIVILFIYLSIFGCVGSSLLRVGFLYLQRAGAALRCGARASHCGGFSCCGARALGAWTSVVVARGL